MIHQPRRDQDTEGVYGVTGKGKSTFPVLSEYPAPLIMQYGSVVRRAGNRAKKGDIHADYAQSQKRLRLARIGDEDGGDVREPSAVGLRPAALIAGADQGHSDLLGLAPRGRPRYKTALLMN